MCKFLTILLVLSSILNARVITVRNIFDDVCVVKPAISTKHTCITKIDLDEGLIDNRRGCYIDTIKVRNAHGMWIGNIATNVLAGEELRYSDYDLRRYKNKGISVEIIYGEQSDIAMQSNVMSVSCPIGMSLYIDDDKFHCKTSYNCPKGLYALDSVSCVFLPENAHRNIKTGFSCDRNYIFIDGECVLRTKCNESELYDSTYNVCLSHPVNAHWIENSTMWNCDSDYVLIENKCVEKTKCIFEQRYDIVTNMCFSPYPNSKWIGDSKNDYQCDSGYFDKGFGQCEEIPNCAHYNEQDNSCYEKPENSHWLNIDGSDWACNEDFNLRYSDSTCVRCYGDTRWDAVNEMCVSKPENSIWIGQTAWACETGFLKTNYTTCEKPVKCGLLQRHDLYTNTCVSLPSHAHWLNEANFECDDGYSYANEYCQEIDPFVVSEHISFAHDISFNIGFNLFENYENKENIVLYTSVDYNLGIRFGTTDVSAKLQGATSIAFTAFDYYSSTGSIETVMSLIPLFGVNFGLNIYNFSIDYAYLLSLQLQSNVLKYEDRIHKFKFGFRANEHWKLNVVFIPSLTKTSMIVKSNDMTISVGVTYEF